MATNLTTISVQLNANAQNFKKNIEGGRKKLQQFKKTSDGVSAGQKKFQNRLRDVAGSIAAVQGPLGPVAGRLNAIGAITGRVNPLLLGFLTATTIASVALVKFATAGARAESQTLKLEAILKATGNAAGQTASDIEELAVSIGKNTLASVQGARDAAGVLLTFKSITGETFGEVLKLSQDLAAVGFGSIQTAAVQLGKALEEPEIGLSALRRVGVSFTEAQKEQIKVLSLTGQQAKAQALIIKALKEQVGGAGEGAAGGLAGAFDTLGENITLFFEKAELGQKIVATLTGVVNKLANAFGRLVPVQREISDNLDGLEVDLSSVNHELETQGKVVTELEKKLKDTFGTGGVGRRNVDQFLKIQEELAEETKKLNTLSADRLRIIEKIELLRKKTTSVDKSEKITLEALNKINRARNREILLLGKTEAQKRAQQDLNKLEDALISKLGDGVEARKKINEILEEERNIRIVIAERQQEEIDRFNEIKKSAEGIGGAFESAGRKITDAFVDGKTGALDFKAILRELLIDIQKTLIQVIILDRIKKGITGAITSAFATPASTPINTDAAGRVLGGVATGGAVQRDVPKVVGERGPEIFVPRTAGSVIPSSLTPGKMGGGSSLVINQNLNFALGVTNTVRTEIANLLPTIQQSTLSAVSDAKLRGGKFAKAFGG